MDQESIILQAREIFVDFNNKFIYDNHEDEAGLMRADDLDYFLDADVLSDVSGPGLFDRTLVVYQALNDELGSIGFIIVCDNDYSTIRHLVVEVDTDYWLLEVSR